MPGIRVSIETRGFEQAILTLDAAPERIELAMREAMVISDLLVEAEAKALVHRRTGRLFSSIGGRVEGLGGSVTGIVGTRVSYAPYVEYGTRAHEILPRLKRALFWRGARHPVRRVRHPGTRPYPYLRPALWNNVDRIVDTFRRHIDDALKG